MKWKITTIILTVALVLVSCGTQTADASDTDAFKMMKTEKYCSWDDDITFKLYVDTHTDVEYIVVETESGVAITPRLKGSRCD